MDFQEALEARFWHNSCSTSTRRSHDAVLTVQGCRAQVAQVGTRTFKEVPVMGKSSSITAVFKATSKEKIVSAPVFANAQLARRI